MFCSKCGTNLPDGSEFCLKCGHAIEFVVGISSAATPLCSNCGAELSEESQFCLKCGHNPAGGGAALVVAGNSSAPAAPALVPMPAPGRRRSKPKPAVWLTIFMLPAIAWVVISNSSAAQQLREFITMSHTETITEGDFPVKPHSFSSFKFRVPPGTIRVSVNGQFSTGSKDMEVYVLTDEAFAAWQSGYSTDTYYDSGKAVQGRSMARFRPVAGHTIFFSRTTPLCGLAKKSMWSRACTTTGGFRSGFSASKRRSLVACSPSTSV